MKIYSHISQQESFRETFLLKKNATAITYYLIRHFFFQEKRKKIERCERRKKIDDEMHHFDEEDNKDLADMFSRIHPENLGEDMKLFFDVQAKNLNKKSGRGYRWHPK